MECGQASEDALAGLAIRTLGRRHDRGLYPAVQDLFVEQLCADRGQRGHATLHIVSMVVGAVVRSCKGGQFSGHGGETRNGRCSSADRKAMVHDRQVKSSGAADMAAGAKK